MIPLRWPINRPAFFLSLLLTCAFISTTAAEKKTGLEMSKGEVRVILLRAGNSLTTNNQPRFEVTYAVEIPKQGAFSDLHFGKTETDEVTLSAKGNPIKVAQEISSLSTGIENLPRSSELTSPTPQPEKAIIGEHVQFTGLKIQEKNIDITIRFHWRGRQLEFPFKSVPTK